MTSTPRTPDTDDDEILRAGADQLQARFASGEITASQYREQLLALKAFDIVRRLALKAADPDITPPAPTTRYRGPATRTATAPAPKRRETR